MKRLLKENSKILIGVVFGLLISSIGVYAATTVAGSNITYSNTKSGLSSTNVQGAIDELYEKADAGKVINKAGKFVAAYTYNQTSGASNYCVTGKEATCKKTTCYQTKTANSCPAGTIILYKVNDLTIIPFNVMFDNGAKMTMQSQKIFSRHSWIGLSEFVKNGGKVEDFGVSEEWMYVGNNTKGPLLLVSEAATLSASWDNVNDQTYTLGTTSFSGKGAYTGCDTNYNCTQNQYTLSEHRLKARLITVQEAKALGCTAEKNSCPKWLTTQFDKSDPSNNRYWTLSAIITSRNDQAIFIEPVNGCLSYHYVILSYGIKPVVEVSK